MAQGSADWLRNAAVVTVPGSGPSGQTSTNALATVAVDPSTGNPSPDGATVTRDQGSGTISAGQATVGTTATQIRAARTRADITVTNTTTTPIYVGPAGVTTTTGHLLPGVVGAAITLTTSAAVFGIVGTGSAVVTYIEVYQ